MPITKELLGLEDISRHDPASGSARQTLVRTGTDVTKLAAQDVPLLDAVYVSGAQSPYEALADTQATKNVEIALRTLRLYSPSQLYNLEHFGATRGAVSAATAVKNTEVWNAIISEISTAGRGGIFVPPGQWQFDPLVPGNTMLDMDTVPEIEVVGVPGQSLIQARDSTQVGALMKWKDTSGVTLRGLEFDKQGTAGGECVLFEGTGGGSPFQMQYIVIQNCRTNKGVHGFALDGLGGHAQHYWISQCIIVDASSIGVRCNDISDGHLLNNLFSVSSASFLNGILLQTDTAAGGRIGGTEAIGNTFSGSSAQLFRVQRNSGCAYDATLHARIRIAGNNMAVGDIEVYDLTVVETSFNRVNSGAILYACNNVSGQTTAEDFRAHGNVVTGAATGNNCLAVTMSGVTLSDFEIVGGKYQSARQHGILFSATGAVMTAGRVLGARVLNCSTQTTNTYSGITISPGDAAGGVTKSIFGDCIIQGPTGAGTPKHKYGFESIAGGATANVKLHDMMKEGYGTNPSLLTGCAEVNNYDLGA